MTTKAVEEQDQDVAEVPEEHGESHPRRRSWIGLAFVAPFLAVYGLFLVWPMILGLYYSFTDKSLTGRPVELVGFENWTEAFTDPAAWDAMWQTGLFTILSTPPLIAVGLICALLTHRARRLGWFLRLAFFAPFVVPVSVVTLIWTWMYQPDGGLINHYLGVLGLPSDNLWMFQEDVMVSVVITTVWWTAGFNFLLYLAGLQSIPDEVYEAASIDGAGAWRQIFTITIPLLAKTTGVVVTLQLIASLRIFDQYYLMAISSSKEVAIQYIYNAGFVGFRIGYASALSYILFVAILIISIVQFRLVGRED